MFQQTNFQEHGDNYSTIIVEDLLNGSSEWQNISQIVKLTFKSLTDVVKQQAESLRNIEKQIAQKVNKQEFNTQIQIKANISDVSRTIAEIASSLDGKISYEDIQQLLKDYQLKSELQYQLSNKLSLEEVNQLIENKQQNNFQIDSKILLQKLEGFEKDINERLSTTVAYEDVEQINQILNQKVNTQDFFEQLELKANKQSVGTALHRKVNINDFENAINNKVDQEQLNVIIKQVEKNVDVDTLEKLTQIIDNKCDKNDFELLIQHLKQKDDNNNHHQQLISDQQQRIDSLTQLQDNMNKNCTSMEQSFSQQVDQIMQEINNLITSNAEQQQITDLHNLINNNVNEIYGEFNKFKDSENTSRQNLSKHSEKMKKMQKLLEKITEEITKQNESVNIIMSQQQETTKTLRGIKKEKTVSSLQEDVKQLQIIVDDINKHKLEKKELTEFKNQLKSTIQNKVNLEEVQTALNTCQQDIAQKLLILKEENKFSVLNIETEINNRVTKKADLSDILEVLKTKADISMLQGLQNRDQEKFVFQQQLQELKQTYERNDSINYKNYNLQDIQSQIEIIQKDLLLKCNIKDVCTLLDTKSNIDDINQIFNKLQVEVEQKVSQNQIETMLQEQSLINESLCSENIVARWSWKSGGMKKGNLVPWETQIVNTLPDNFVWNQGQTSILIVAPGLYQVCFGFYSSKKVTAQLLINGEAHLQTCGNKKIIKEQKNNTNDQITGTTLQEFVILPGRARLSTIYEGEPGAEGFLTIKRL